MKNKRTTTRFKSSARESRGWALVAVITVSAFASILLFSLAGLSSTLMQSEGVSRQKSLALKGAEIGMDYTRKLMNRSILTGQRSLVEPPEGAQEMISELPSQYVPQVGSNCKVKIRVRRISDADLQLIAQKQSPAIPLQANTALRKDKTAFKAVGSLVDDWRLFSISDIENSPSKGLCWMVEVTSYNGIFATSLRSILVPGFPDTYLASRPPLNDDAFFRQGVSANNQVQLGTGQGYLDVMSPGEGFGPGTQTTPGTPNEFKAVVQTNGTATANPGTTIYGDLKVTNPIGSTGTVASGDGTTVFGRVETNSILNSANQETSMNGFQGHSGDLPDFSSAPPDNVWAFADYFQDPTAFFSDGLFREGVNEQQPTLSLDSTTLNQTTPNPVPTPANTYPLTSFPPPSPEGSPPPEPPSVPSGQSYRTFGIDSSNATVPLLFNESGSGAPTKIFVEDNPNTEFAIKLDAKYFSNSGNSTDLQIYYAGNKPITIQMSGGDGPGGGAEFKALIYAPNSKVTTTGAGDFEGAILSKDVAIQHQGSLRLDPDAARVAADKRESGPGSGSRAGSSSRAATYYRATTWQHVSGRLVGLNELSN